GCLNNGECGGTKPVCDGASRSCRACGSDAECGPATPICLPSGACAACTATDVTHCAAATPRCDTASGVGVCVACLDSSQCSGVGGFCVPGCGPAPRNGCPTGQSCLDVMNGVGDCSGAMCHTDADCRAPLAHCDLGGGSADGRCVQCVFDTDCDAPLVCDGTK